MLIENIKNEITSCHNDSVPNTLVTDELRERHSATSSQTVSLSEKDNVTTTEDVASAKKDWSDHEHRMYTLDTLKPVHTF